jgi:hypothetical protein
MGKPIGGMRRFLAKVRPPAGTRDAILTTEAAPQPDKKTGRMPSEEELAKWQRVRPIMNEILQRAGLVNVAEDKVLVTALKGPLEEGWQKRLRPSPPEFRSTSKAPVASPSPRVPRHPPRRERRSHGRSG